LTFLSYLNRSKKAFEFQIMRHQGGAVARRWRLQMQFVVYKLCMAALLIHRSVLLVGPGSDELYKLMTAVATGHRPPPASLKDQEALALTVNTTNLAAAIPNL